MRKRFLEIRIDKKQLVSFISMVTYHGDFVRPLSAGPLNGRKQSVLELDLYSVCYIKVTTCSGFSMNPGSKQYVFPLYSFGVLC